MNQPDKEPPSAPAQTNRSTVRTSFSRSKQDILYKLLAQSDDCCSSDIFKGRLIDISTEGACVEGELPDSECLFSLGEGQLLVGCNLYTPNGLVKALGQTKWLQVVRPKLYRFGMQFMRLDREYKTNLQNFLINNEIRKRTGRYSRPQPE